jgi:hypothetical protein
LEYDPKKWQILILAVVKLNKIVADLKCQERQRLIGLSEFLFVSRPSILRQAKYKLLRERQQKERVALRQR